SGHLAIKSNIERKAGTSGFRQMNSLGPAKRRLCAAKLLRKSRGALHPRNKGIAFAICGFRRAIPGAHLLASLRSLDQFLAFRLRLFRQLVSLDTRNQASADNFIDIVAKGFGASDVLVY